MHSERTVQITIWVVITTTFHKDTDQPVAGWLAGWLVAGWLVSGWLAGWLADSGWLAGQWLAGWMVSGWLAGWLVSASGWLIRYDKSAAGYKVKDALKKGDIWQIGIDIILVPIVSVLSIYYHYVVYMAMPMPFLVCGVTGVACSKRQAC